MAEQRGNMATEDSTDRDADGAASAVATTDAGATRTTFAGGHDRMEKIFKWASYASGILLVAVIALIFLQLVVQAIPALTKNNVLLLINATATTERSLRSR